MKKSKLNKRAVRVFSICLILMLVLPIISVFFVGAYNYHVYYDVGASANIVIDGYYYLSVDATNNDTTWFTGVYVDVWDESINDYRIVELSYITVSDYYTHPPIGSSQHVYYWNGYVYYNGLYVQFKGGSSTVYRSLQNNVTTHAPHFFYIKEGATKDTSGYEIWFKRSSNQSQTWFDLTFGYTLTFDSQGGSSINPIEDIEEGGTVNLVDNLGLYLPQFIPEKEGYTFRGWCINPGEKLTSITLHEDTTLYAMWDVADDYRSVTINFPFKTSLNGELKSAGEYVYQIGSRLNIYFTWDNSLNNIAHYYGEFIVDGHVIQGTEVSTNVWNLQYIVMDNLTVDINDYEVYKATIHLDPYPDLNLSYFSFNGEIDSVLATQDKEYYFDIRQGIHIEFDLFPPLVIAKINSFSVNSNPNDYSEDISYVPSIVVLDGTINSDIVETDGTYGFYTHIYYDVMPTKSCSIFIYGKSITEYDMTHERTPVIRYDESGEAHWAFSEVEILDTDWSEFDEQVPSRLNGIFDGLYSLSGLAVLVPVIMMVSFALWFVRRS